MALTKRERQLIAAIQDGLPLVPEPYQAIAESLGETEDWVLAKLAKLLKNGAIKRWGVVVRHHELGFQSNAMVVWDVPDERVSEIGQAIAKTKVVSLCYRRPRILPRWPYNLFCMIHGMDRETVLAQIDRIRSLHGMQDLPYAVLFSRRRFKQRGARYVEEA
jgi:DNA-binding Lrp family transcriptional regulator